MEFIIAPCSKIAGLDFELHRDELMADWELFFLVLV